MIEIHKYIFKYGIVKKVPNYLDGGFVFKEDFGKNILRYSNKSPHAYFWAVPIYEAIT